MVFICVLNIDVISVSDADDLDGSPVKQNLEHNIGDEKSVIHSTSASLPAESLPVIENE